MGRVCRDAGVCGWVKSCVVAHERPQRTCATRRQPPPSTTPPLFPNLITRPPPPPPPRSPALPARPAAGRSGCAGRPPPARRASCHRHFRPRRPRQPAPGPRTRRPGHSRRHNAGGCSPCRPKRVWADVGGVRGSKACTGRPGRPRSQAQRPPKPTTPRPPPSHLGLQVRPTPQQLGHHLRVAVRGCVVQGRAAGGVGLGRVLANGQKVFHRLQVAVSGRTGGGGGREVDASVGRRMVAVGAGDRGRQAAPSLRPPLPSRPLSHHPHAAHGPSNPPSPFYLLTWRRPTRS